MKVREALYQIEQLDKLKCNLEKIASAVFRNENLSKEIAEKAEISGDSPFFYHFKGERYSLWRN